MNPKKANPVSTWLESVSWGAVIRGFVIVFGGLGIGVGAVKSQADSTPVAPAMEQVCMQDYPMHKALDSARWVYYEERMVKVETAVNDIRNATKETNEILRREFGK